MPKKTASIYGIKYVLSPWQAKSLMYEARCHIKPTAQDNSATVYTVYYDALPSHAGRRYQACSAEQLILRSYQPFPTAEYVYLELKSDDFHCQSIQITLEAALAFIQNGVAPSLRNEQQSDALYAIGKFLQAHTVRPSVYMKYTRTSFVAKSDPSLRLTLDSDVTARRSDFFSDRDDERALDSYSMYMQIETKNSLPDWLTRALRQLDIRRSGFSKQTAAYYI